MRTFEEYMLDEYGIDDVDTELTEVEYASFTIEFDNNNN